MELLAFWRTHRVTLRSSRLSGEALFEMLSVSGGAIYAMLHDEFIGNSML